MGDGQETPIWDESLSPPLDWRYRAERVGVGGGPLDALQMTMLLTSHLSKNHMPSW